MPCVPRNKAGQPFRARGASAEEHTACPGRGFWAVGEHPPDCHEFRGVLSFPFWAWYIYGHSAGVSILFSLTPRACAIMF